MTTRVLSLNIRHGGGSRTGRLIDWILSKTPDVTLLTESRDNAFGQQIKSRLSAKGLHSITAARGPTINGVLVAARSFTFSETITPPNSPVGDLVLMQLADLTTIGCYFPQGKAKSPFFERCMEIALKEIHRPLLMIGDFNTGRNEVDIEGSGTRFHCADQFIALSEQAGLVDVWRFRHGDRRDWTWRSTKNGFRIDHAFGNPAFIETFPNYRCEIDHEPRLCGMTDHSAITVDLE